MPIFIITCDRLKVLKESIQSYYDQIKEPFKIVIIDFGSTHVPTVRFLKHLEDKNIKVYWEKKITTVFDLNNASRIIDNYFKDHPVSNYVVTDPDIVLDNVNGDILSTYSFLLETLPRVSVVAPMLRIDDIPDYYPNKEKLITGEKGLHRKFHSSEINMILYKGKIVKYIFAAVDTTFGMFKRGMPWRRMTKGIRVLSPYAARHLDWYINPKELSLDQKYYAEHASKQIANWSILDG